MKYECRECYFVTHGKPECEVGGICPLEDEAKPDAEKIMKQQQDKREKIESCLQHVFYMLQEINPEKHWVLEYTRTKNPELRFTRWQLDYHHIRPNQEYICVWNKTVSPVHLLYVVDVTGDSVITAIGELMNLLAKKL